MRIPACFEKPRALPCVKNFTAESAPIRSRYATLRTPERSWLSFGKITVTDIFRTIRDFSGHSRPINPLTDFIRYIFRKVKSAVWLHLVIEQLASELDKIVIA